MDATDIKYILSDAALQIDTAAETLNGIRDKVDATAALDALQQAADAVEALENEYITRM